MDIHSLLTRIQRRGFEVGDRRLTTDFLGGIFSLDGIHPTNTGYAIVANAFLKEINRRFDADIPEVSVEGIMKTDQLVLPQSEAHDSEHEGHVSADHVRALRTALFHTKDR